VPVLADTATVSPQWPDDSGEAREAHTNFPKAV